MLVFRLLSNWFLMTLALVVVGSMPHIILRRNPDLHPDPYENAVADQPSDMLPRIGFVLSRHLIISAMALSTLASYKLRNPLASLIVRLPWVSYFLRYMCFDMGRWMRFMRTSYSGYIPEIDRQCSALLIVFALAIDTAGELVLVPFVRDFRNFISGEDEANNRMAENVADAAAVQGEMQMQEQQAAVEANSDVAAPGGAALAAGGADANTDAPGN